MQWADVLPVARFPCDNWNFNSSNPCLYAGGNYNQNSNHGLFYVNYTTASNSNGNIGARLQAVTAKKSSSVKTGVSLFLYIFGTDSRSPLGGDLRFKDRASTPDKGDGTS